MNLSESAKTAYSQANNLKTDVVGVLTKEQERQRKDYMIKKVLHIDDKIIGKLIELDPFNYHFSDRGASQLFADVFRGELLFDTTAKCWRHYDGAVWRLDESGVAAYQLAKKFFDNLMHFSSSIEDQARQAAFREFYVRYGGKGKRDTLLKDVISELPVSSSNFDTNKNLLNVQNGTIELDTMTFREHRPEDMLTKCCNCEYKPGIVSNEWISFTKQVIPNDIEKLEFLQKAVGYSLTGKPLERLYILYGKSTRNGKSTFLESVGEVLGDYASAADPQTLAERKRDSRAPSEDLARLAGCRFLRVSEPPQSMVFDVALVKKITGADVVTARFLNQNSFEYLPQFTLFLNTNYLPKVFDDTMFTSGRVNVIEFSRHFSSEEQDLTLKDRLKSKQNLTGILNWMLDGLRMYKEHGLSIPHTVELETDEYRRISDKLNDFIDEVMDPAPGAVVHAKAVYEKYKKWCTESGYHSEGKCKFFDKLRVRGIFSDTGTIDGKTVRNVVKNYTIDFENLDI